MMKMLNYNYIYKFNITCNIIIIYHNIIIKYLFFVNIYFIIIKILSNYINLIKGIKIFYKHLNYINYI